MRGTGTLFSTSQIPVFESPGSSEAIGTRVTLRSFESIFGPSISNAPTEHKTSKKRSIDFLPDGLHRLVSVGPCIIRGHAHGFGPDVWAFS